jgi:two-component system sensor histidine kinase RegB
MLLLVVLALRRQIRPAPWLMLTLIVIEVGGINTLIALNGAASNPFNAILLVPLVLGFMLLPYTYGALVLFISIAAQLSQLWMLPEHSHHDGQMLGHFYAMVGSFILTSLLMAAVVLYFRLLLARQALSIHGLREKQLRDEQLLAIGTAAAQLSHDVATPVQSIRLILEEMLEQQPQAQLLQSLENQFQRIEQHLTNWREVANDVREKRLHAYHAPELCLSLQHLMAVARPESPINWQSDLQQNRAIILADRTLLPALTSVIINACEAAFNSDNKQVDIKVFVQGESLCLRISNKGTALNKEQIAILGNRLLPSQHGHGIGAVLSNATIEKFGGEVNWQQQEQVIVTTVTLPLTTPQHHA